MPVSYAIFEKFKDRGMAAYRAEDWVEARVYLLQAAKAMTELAAETDASREPELREQREETARKLLALANACKDRHAGRAARPEKAGDSAGNEESAQHDWMVREKPTIRFDDIAGLDDVKQEILIKMIYPVRHPDLARRFGIVRGGGVLLYGPPGTGKTMMARAVASEIDAAFFTVKPSQIMSKWVGEAEQNVAELFRQARAETTAIIFIDEVEALVPARRDSQSTVMQRVVPQMLAELEGFDSRRNQQANTLLFIAATNEPWSIDPAMLRPGRLDEKIYVGLPDAPARRRLLELYLAHRPMAADVSLEELTERLAGYSGADIKNICHKAATLPFLASIADGRERCISRADLLSVLNQIRPSVTTEVVARFESFRRTGS